MIQSGSVNPFHSPKCENNDWIVIDSLNSDQIRISNPLKWLTDRQQEFLKATGSYQYELITLAKGS